MAEGGSPRAAVKRVPPYSRTSFDVAQDMGSQDASIMVTSDIPVIPEREMYRDNRGAGSGTVGGFSY